MEKQHTSTPALAHMANNSQLPTTRAARSRESRSLNPSLDEVSVGAGAASVARRVWGAGGGGGLPRARRSWVGVGGNMCRWWVGGGTAGGSGTGLGVGLGWGWLVLGLDERGWRK